MKYRTIYIVNRFSHHTFFFCSAAICSGVKFLNIALEPPSSSVGNSGNLPDESLQ